jgi:spore coat protein CotH
MRYRILSRRYGLAGVVLAMIGFGAGSPASAKPDKLGADADLFNGLKVLRIQIEIPPAGIAALGNAGWGNGQERPTVAATVREGNAVFTNVLVHLKGAAGSFRPVDDNPGLTLNFEKKAPGQTFHGLRKLSLNNSVQDPSFLTEKICRELFAAAGVPAPRAAYAAVKLNGRDLGLHVLLEGFNKQFLKRNFKNVKGNLYDGGFVQDINGFLAVNSGDDPKQHPGLKALIAAVGEPDPAKRWTRLLEVLDMDRFLAYVAMDVIQVDWDGYAMNRNNWRLFHDLGANKMVFFPHGLDQMFGVQRASPDCPILPHMQGMVARAVIGTPEGRRRYLEKISQLYTNVFHVDALLKRVDEVAAAIRPVIAESDPEAGRRHDEEVRWLKERIRQRDTSLKRQLSAPAGRP